MDIQKKIKITFYIFFHIVFKLILTQVESQLLNSIIRLAEDPYRYNHFSFTSEADMIIDTESFPITNIRKFYGIKKNGREYFNDSSGNTTFNFCMEFDYQIGRLEGESIIIKMKSTNLNINGKEFLLGISKSVSSGYKTELYNLKENYSYNYITSELFVELSGNIFSLIADPLNSDNEFNYFISYIGYTTNTYIYKLYIKKISFFLNYDSNNGTNRVDMYDTDSIPQKIISCFLTDNYFYICFYINKELKLTILVFDPIDKSDKKHEIHSFTQEYDKRFYKGIHLKEEIGFFAYFKDTGYIPSFSLYRIKVDKNIEIYKTYNKIQTTQ